MESKIVGTNKSSLRKGPTDFVISCPERSKLDTKFEARFPRFVAEVAEAIATARSNHVEDSEKMLYISAL